MKTQRISEIAALWDVVLCGPVVVLAPETVFRLSSSLGVDLILKDIGGVEGKVQGQLDFEYEVLLHVHSAGLPVAVPLRDVLGYTRTSSLSARELAALPYVMLAVPIFFAHWAISATMEADYIRQELDAAVWLYDNLDRISNELHDLRAGR